MALARLALKNLQQKVISPSSLSSQTQSLTLSNIQKQRWSSELPKRLSTTAPDQKSDDREVSVSEDDNKSKLFPRRRRGRSLWRNNHRLGNALWQATENINKLFENLKPSKLMGRVKEEDEWYKLRYEVPGLAKEDLKITVADGVLIIKGEIKEEEEEGSDDEYWSSTSYGCYNATVVLPEDAKVDEIKAEMKDGVLYITIPRTEMKEKDVKEIPVD